MLTRKQAIENTKKADVSVYSSLSDIYQLIYYNSILGYPVMEVFVDTKNAEKYARSLRKKGFYCRVTPFESLSDECLLFVSWMSNL